jgi:hypothetical protein
MPTWLFAKAACQLSIGQWSARPFTIGVAVAVAVGIDVGVSVGVAVGVDVTVAVGVAVAVAIEVAVGPGSRKGVGVELQAAVILAKTKASTIANIVIRFTVHLLLPFFIFCEV